MAASDMPPCPYENEREFPVELRKIRRVDELTKRTDAEDEFSGLVSGIKSSTSKSKVEEFLKLNPTELLAKLDDESTSVQSDALEAIKKILVAPETKESLQAFLKGDLIMKCINLIKMTEIPMVASGALLILHFISYGDSELTKSLLHSESLLPLLLDLLKTNFNLSEKAVLTLGNIAADSIHCRNYLFDNGIVEALQDLGSHYLPKAYQRNFAWLLSNLCRSKGLTPKFNEVKLLLPLIRKIIKESKDEETLMHCCIAVHRLTFDGDVQKIQAVIDNGIVLPLIRLVNINYEKTLIISLKAVGNISAGTVNHTSKLISGKIIPKLRTLLQYDNNEAMKHALWILSNICADNSTHIQAVMDADVFPFFYPILSDGVPDVQLEAATTLKNVIKNGTDKQITEVIHINNLLGPLCRLLNGSNVNAFKIVIVSLSEMLRRAKVKGSVENLVASMEIHGAIDKIEALQYHENKEIQQVAMLMVDNYFEKKDPAMES